MTRQSEWVRQRLAERKRRLAEKEKDERRARARQAAAARVKKRGLLGPLERIEPMDGVLLGHEFFLIAERYDGRFMMRARAADAAGRAATLERMRQWGWGGER